APLTVTGIHSSNFHSCFRFYSQFNFYTQALRPRDGVACLKRKLFQEKLNNGLNMFNMASYFCIEDPLVLDHNVAFNYRAKQVDRFHSLFSNMAEQVDNPQHDLMSLLLNATRIDRNGQYFFAIPCNLACYQLVPTDDNRYT